jgi:hypothetical protein
MEAKAAEKVTIKQPKPAKSTISEAKVDLSDKSPKAKTGPTKAEPVDLGTSGRSKADRKKSPY